MQIQFVDYHHPRDGVIRYAKTDILPPIESIIEIDEYQNCLVKKIRFFIEYSELQAVIHVWTNYVVGV